MVVHKIAGIILKDKKFLAVKTSDDEVLITPGGRVEKNETPEETLRRELREELDAGLLSMKPFLTFMTKTDDNKNDLLWEGYFADIEGMPTPNSEIEKLFWLDSRFEEELKELNVSLLIKETIIPKLLDMDLIE